MYPSLSRGLRGRDRLIVGFTTTSAIGAYHHWSCEFESRSRRELQHYVINFVSDLRQVGGFLRVLRFPSVSDLRQVGGFLRVLRFPPVSDLRQVGGFLRVLRFPPTVTCDRSVVFSGSSGFLHSVTCGRLVVFFGYSGFLHIWLATGQWFSLGTPVSSTN